MKVFVCYRREDSKWPAQHLAKELSQRLGAGSVVFDVDTIGPGVDYRRYLDEQVRACDILLAVVGDRWLELLNRRLADPKDWVRIEIQSALDSGALVIPVLIDAARMPGEDDLPHPLVEFASRNAIDIEAGAGLESQLIRLVDSLPGALEEHRATRARESDSPPRQGLPVWRDRLGSAARQWNSETRPHRLLLSGSALSTVELQLRASGSELGGIEDEFVRASTSRRSLRRRVLRASLVSLGVAWVSWTLVHEARALEMPDVARNLAVGVLAYGTPSPADPTGGVPASGSGTVIAADDEELFIATARHVVVETDRIEVRFAWDSTTIHTATLEWEDDTWDLALISVPVAADVSTATLDFSRLGNSEALSVGSVVVPVGCPDGKCWAYGAPDQVLGTSGSIVDFQSVFVSGGSSGGPLFNSNWEVVGIVLFNDFPRAGALSSAIALEQILTSSTLAGREDEIRVLKRPGLGTALLRLLAP